MTFEWDPEKAAANGVKHGVPFSEAISVFEDPLSISIPDVEHSDAEERFVTVGMSDMGHVLLVYHTDRDDRNRIIGARKATRNERRAYEDGDYP